MMHAERLTGICSVIGGAAWVGACFVHNSLPQGCIGDACADRSMRGTTPTAEVLFLVAGLMLAASGVGLLYLARQRGRIGRAGVVGGISGGVGLALLAAAGIAFAIDSNWEGMPGLVVPGVVLLAVGLALIGWMIFRARILPTWLSLLLLATALLMLGANEQTSMILLAVPFGLVWLLAGVLLLRQSPGPIRGASAA
jgi:hypothetical protein